MQETEVSNTQMEETVTAEGVIGNTSVVDMPVSNADGIVILTVALGALFVAVLVYVLTAKRDGKPKTTAAPIKQPVVAAKTVSTPRLIQ